jgi:hypothetical protein
MRRGEHAARQPLRSSPAPTWLVMQPVLARAVTLRALHGSCEEASFRARPFGIGVAIATSTLRSCCTPSACASPYAVSPINRRPRRSRWPRRGVALRSRVAPLVAPLKDEATVIGNADAAPRHWSAPGRAGAGRNPGGTTRHPDRRTLRRNSGRIIYENYATFSFPAHTRVASGPESPAPAVATLSVPPATLRAGTEPFCSPGAARGVGLMGEIKRGR